MKVLICFFLVCFLTNHVAFARGDHARGRNQQARIKQGVKSGELTRSEAQDLRKNQRELRQDRKELQQNRQEARADGKVTREEKKALHQEKKDLREKRNDASKDIYEQKHDSDSQPPKSTEDLIKETDQEPEEE